MGHHARSIALAIVLLACGSPRHAGYKPPSPMPTVDDVVARLARARDGLRSFRADSVMDYWVGNQRVKGTVLVMGEIGAKVRFNALSPAGGDVLVDMACDGNAFVYVDKQHNCQLRGPCSRSSIASLLHVELEPDDFIHLALGVPPVLASSTGEVTWNADRGHQRIALSSPEGSQTIEIDARDGRWDVAASELKDRDGRVMWSVENADWRRVKDAAGADHRLPGKTRFKSPGDRSDLLVVWNDRVANVEIDDSKFVVPLPAGLPVCGS